VALARTVRLAGGAGLRRPVRDALVQRAFETWVHAEDLRLALRLDRRPPAAADLRPIVELGVSLLPLAMARGGGPSPGPTVRLVLTGAGGGEWEVAGSTAGDGSPVAAALVTDVTDFCRLMAGRIEPTRLPHRRYGDAPAIASLLAAAATLGCD